MRSFIKPSTAALVQGAAVAVFGLFTLLQSSQPSRTLFCTFREGWMGPHNLYAALHTHTHTRRSKSTTIDSDRFKGTVKHFQFRHAAPRRMPEHWSLTTATGGVNSTVLRCERLPLSVRANELENSHVSGSANTHKPDRRLTDMDSNRKQNQTERDIKSCRMKFTPGRRGR